jgi:hypothetical protein
MTSFPRNKHVGYKPKSYTMSHLSVVTIFAENLESRLFHLQATVKVHSAPPTILIHRPFKILINFIQSQKPIGLV